MCFFFPVQMTYEITPYVKSDKQDITSLAALFYTSNLDIEIPVRNLPEIYKNVFPALKSEIQIRENLSRRNAKKSTIRKIIKLFAKISCHTVTVFE